MGSYEFKIKTECENIDFINKIIEAYEGMGVVRTKNASEGNLSIILTEDFKDDMRSILEDLNTNWVKAEIVSEGNWDGKL